jgi:MFS family permease
VLQGEKILSANEGATVNNKSVVRVVADAPRPVIVLVTGVFVNRAGSFFTTFLVLFLRQIGFTSHEMPLVLLGTGAVTPLGALLGGWLSDRISRKASLIISTTMSSVWLAVIGLASMRAVVLIGVIFAAMFVQSYLPAASALLVDHTAERDRVPIFAFFRLALNLGSVAGLLVAAAVAPHDIKTLFIISSCTYATFSVFLAVGLPPAARGAGAGEDRAPQGGHRQIPWRLTIFCSAVAVSNMVYVQYNSTVALSVSGRHGVRAYALLLTLNGLMVIFCEMPLSAVTRRMNWWIPLTAGTIGMSVGIVVWGSAGAYGLAITGVVLWTVGEMLFSPVAASAAAALAPSGRVGLYQGYLAMVQAIAYGLGPAVGTFVYGFSPSVLWLSCLAAGALACAGFIAAGRISPAAMRVHQEPTGPGAE